MCGLVGVAGAITGVQDRAFKCLLILDAIRGDDSTGMAAVNKFTGDVTVAKQLGSPFELFQEWKFNQAIGGNNKVLMGHNRLATKGGIIRRNAHPFLLNDIVGMHNGTLSDKHKLADHTDFQVDSENLLHHIEKFGVKDALSNLGGTGNAWALVWWDMRDKTLFLLRNEERPLYICRSEDEKTIYWASERWMLEVALERCEIKRGPITPIEKDTLYSVEIDDNGELQKAKTKKMEAPKPVKTTTTTQGGVETKKSFTKSTPLLTGTGKIKYDVSYLSPKQIEFEALCINKDIEHGAEYVTLFDEKNPFIESRLYLRPKDGLIRKHVSKGFSEELHGLGSARLKADIASFVQRGRGYYKVSPWTVNLVIEDAEDKLYPSHNGKFLTKQEWEKKYPSCVWCSSPLIAEDKNRLTTQGQCLCADCASDKELMEYVSFI